MELKDILIDKECSMLKAMEVLNRTSKKVLFVAQDGVLTAAITDGDIRRWILAKGNLNAKVKDIANYNPKFIYEKDRLKAREFMRKKSVEALPIVDKNKRIISVVFWDETDIKPKKNLNVPVVIMAGGLGTRLNPYTKVLPKPLIPIGDIPIAEHIINRFCNFGCNHFFMIVNYKKNMIKAYFNEIEKDYEITFIDEDQPLGTGGGLSLLKGKIDTTFILSNCDILIEEDFEEIYYFHKKEKNLITMVCSVKKLKIPYGVVEIDRRGNIEAIKEKPELSFMTNTGCYIVDPRVIQELKEQYIDFPNIIEKYRQAGDKVGVFPISENGWMDMGQFDKMKEMRKKLVGDG